MTFTGMDVVRHGLWSKAKPVPTTKAAARAWLKALANSPLAFHLDDPTDDIPSFGPIAARLLGRARDAAMRLLGTRKAWSYYDWHLTRAEKMPPKTNPPRRIVTVKIHNPKVGGWVAHYADESMSRAAWGPTKEVAIANLKDKTKTKTKTKRNPPRKCRICGKPVVLSPSATDRAKKFGGTAEDYYALFPDHAECVIAKRSAESKTLMRRLAKTNPLPARIAAALEQVGRRSTGRRSNPSQDGIDYVIKPTHIDLVRTGDIILHEGKLKTLSERHLKRGFMGRTIFGDSYRAGKDLVDVVVIKRAMPTRRNPQRLGKADPAVQAALRDAAAWKRRH